MERSGKKPSARTVRLRTPPVEATVVTERLGQLAHEVNNLLDGSMRQVGLVLHRVSKIQQDIVEIDDMERRLKSVMVSMQQMGRMVEQAGNNRVPIGGDLGGSLSIDDAVDHAMAMFEQRAAVHGIALSRQVEVGAGRLPAATLPCVLLNGLKNAIEAMTRRPNPGVITIAARLGALGNSQRLVVEITDEGPGLASNLLGKDLFSPGVTSKSTGLGLGLGIVKQAVEELGGRVELVPREGGGSTGMSLRAIVPLERLRINGSGLDTTVGGEPNGANDTDQTNGGGPCV